MLNFLTSIQTENSVTPNKKLVYVLQSQEELFMRMYLFTALPDYSKTYIYFITDNFSRKILGYKVSQLYSSSVMLENLREVYIKYDLGYENQVVDLIVDNGIENKGAVNEAILNKEISINKPIAQKDIRFSNSMIEAVNKQMKYNGILFCIVITIRQLRL